MKIFFTLLCMLLQMVVSGQAMWRTLGASDFNHPSYGNTDSGNDFRHNSRITVKNGNVYVMNREVGKSNANFWFVLSKFTNNEWQHIETPFYTNNNTDPFVFAVDNNDVPYLFLNDPLNADRASVKKFDGTNWVDLGGSAVSTASSYVLEMSIGNNNFPIIMYSENSLTKVKRFNGSSWDILPTSDLDGSGLYLGLGNDDVPYCCYSANNEIFVKKFNGIGWEEIGITGFPSGILGFAIDNNNVPYLITNPLRRFNGTSWETLPLPPQFYGQISTLIFDSENSLYLSYYSEQSGFGKRVQKYFAGAWQPVVGTSSLGPLEIAISNDVFFYQYTSMGSRNIVQKKIASGFESLGQNSDLVDGVNTYNTTIPVHPDLLLKDNLPLIAYGEPTVSGVMAIKQFTNSSWNYLNNEPALSESTVYDCKLLDNSTEGIAIAYLNKISSGVSRVTVKKSVGAFWENLGATNFSLDAEYQLAFKINHANVPYVAYKSGRVQKFNGNSWEFVGGTAFSGEKAVELAFDNNDQPYMIYDGIVVKKLNATNYWEEIGSADLAVFTNAKLPNILCDANNNIIIAFIDSTKNIHVMQWSGSNWTAIGPIIQTNGDCTVLKLNLDSNNIIHILYNSLSHNFRIMANLKKFNGTDWESVGTPDFSPGEISEADLEFSTNNTPFVVYNSSIGLYCKYFGDENALSVTMPVVNAQSVIVWPNPATAQVSVMATSKVEQLDLFDLTGKKIVSSQSAEISISSLQKGLYLLRVKTQNGTYTEKLVKN